MRSEPTPDARVTPGPAVVRDPESSLVGVCLWRTSGYVEALALSEAALTRGGTPYLVRAVDQPYPRNEEWQRLCALGIKILTVLDDVTRPDVSDAVLLGEMRKGVQAGALFRAAQAAAPRAQPLPEETRRARSTVQRTPEERAELLRAIYSDETDDGLR